jgi:hypothetical protein
VFLNKALDFGAPEPGQFSESDAGQEWFLSRRVIVHPSFADAKPGRDLVDRQQTFGLTCDR